MRVAAPVASAPAEGPFVRLGKMSAAFAASDLLRGAMAFATSVIIARGIGLDEFGRWTLYATWASALTVIVDLGFGVLLTREAARGGRVGSLVAGALAARLVVFSPIALLFVFAGAARAGMAGASGQDVVLVMAIAGAGMAYGCLAAIYRASAAWLVVILTVEAIGATIQCVGSALIVVAGAGVSELLRLAVGVQVMQLVIALVGWRVIAPGDRLERPSARSMWTSLQRAFPFALTGIIANAQTRMGPILLGVFGTTADLASLGAAQRLEGLARRLPSAALGAALPVLADEIERGRPAPVRGQFDGALRWFAFAAAVALVAGASPIVRLTYGESFAGASTALAWAGVGLVPSLMNAGRKVYLYAAGRELIVLRWSAVACLLQAVGCVSLIAHFGAAGAMLAFVVGEAAIWAPLRAAARSDR